MWLISLAEVEVRGADFVMTGLGPEEKWRSKYLENDRLEENSNKSKLKSDIILQFFSFLSCFILSMYVVLKFE